MDATPKHIDLKKVQEFMEQLDWVEEVHDLHIWALSTTETVLTAHLVMPTGCDDSYIFEIREQLRQKFGIHHSTLQIEQTFDDDEYRHEKV